MRNIHNISNSIFIQILRFRTRLKCSLSKRGFARIQLSFHFIYFVREILFSFFFFFNIESKVELLHDFLLS